MTDEDGSRGSWDRAITEPPSLASTRPPCRRARPSADRRRATAAAVLGLPRVVPIATRLALRRSSVAQASLCCGWAGRRRCSGREEGIEGVPALDGVLLRPARAVPARPDAREREQRQILVEGEPCPSLLAGCRVRFVGRLTEGRRRYEAAIFGLEPGVPVRRPRIPDVCHPAIDRAGPEIARRRRHAPAGHLHDTFAAVLADDRRHGVGVNAGQRWLIAAVIAADLEEAPQASWPLSMR
jgi:hypothetical protein